VLDVRLLLFDDENEAKLEAHGVTVSDVQEVFDKWPRFYRNRPDRRASHVMVGPTRRGVLLVVPIEPVRLVGELWDGVWRPVTAFSATPSQVARYRKGT
jgi:uncharacterized DUF497 family protein